VNACVSARLQLTWTVVAILVGALVIVVLLRRGVLGGRDEVPPGPEGSEARSARVASVTDGDTLRLGDGEAVRLVGIDAPERGTCGSERATRLLTKLTWGKQVTLLAPVDDRDRYGRLLRYVDVGTVDAGLRLIESGLAVARYDSRDGYDAHPREQQYVHADRASPDVTCDGPRH
jgi:endonuclease YncB( thermonuclease family)